MRGALWSGQLIDSVQIEPLFAVGQYQHRSAARQLNGGENNKFNPDRLELVSPERARAGIRL